MVTGHAMGTMIGIDTMVLLGALAFVIAERARRETGSSDRVDSRFMKLLAIGTNHSTLLFVVGLHVVGGVVGMNRYVGNATPDWCVTLTPWVFAVGGGLAFVFFALLVASWLPQVFRRVPPE
jgi:hypothetical protein